MKLPARACRRNYSAVFESILESPELMQTPGVVLTLIGYGDLAIPAILEDKVAKRVSLSYKACWHPPGQPASSVACLHAQPIPKCLAEGQKGAPRICVRRRQVCLHGHTMRAFAKRAA
jgi:hypothetical protein